VATHSEKVAAMSAISFPEWEDIPLPQPPTRTAHTPKFRGLWIQGLNDIVSEMSNQSTPGLDGICYLAIRLWNKIDPDGVCTLINTLVRQGLPIELKNAEVVVIGTQRKRDLTNPKSYRCISPLSNIV
jgi:hypothetical protein